MRKVFTAGLLALFLCGCADGVQLYTEVKTCKYQGKAYRVGLGQIPAGDGCNTCVCGKDNTMSCTEKVCLSESEIAKLANPAAVKCAEDGFTNENRKNPDGSEVGYCLDDATKTECIAWQYFRGECVLGETVISSTAKLLDVTDGKSSGKAEATYTKQKFTAKISAQLPPPPEGFHYEAFLVKALPVMDKVSVGELVIAEDSAEYQLSFESPDNFSDYTRVMVTLEKPGDKDATKTILDGTFEKVSNQ
jgi:putative hemolysin